MRETTSAFVGIDVAKHRLDVFARAPRTSTGSSLMTTAPCLP